MQRKTSNTPNNPFQVKWDKIMKRFELYWGEGNLCFPAHEEYGVITITVNVCPDEDLSELGTHIEFLQRLKDLSLLLNGQAQHTSDFYWSDGDLLHRFEMPNYIFEKIFNTKIPTDGQN